MRLGSGRWARRRRAEVRGAKRPLPDKGLVPHLPRGQVACRPLTGLWQRQGDSANVVPVGHAPTVAAIMPKRSAPLPPRLPAALEEDSVCDSPVRKLQMCALWTFRVICRAPSSSPGTRTAACRHRPRRSRMAQRPTLSTAPGSPPDPSGSHGAREIRRCVARDREKSYAALGR